MVMDESEYLVQSMSKDEMLNKILMVSFVMIRF